MTAGSFCYIGPQGIVHGTTITILNAGRMYLDSSDLSGKVYVSSGLGGMSGAQAKAAVICGAITVIAEVDPAALDKRHEQGWVMEKSVDVKQCILRVKEARRAKKPLSIGFLGNIVTLWEALAEEDELLVELGSDQTSCHNVFGGGYMPVDHTFEEGHKLMVNDHEKFKEEVNKSLNRQVTAINKLTARGMKFWDYGNSFLLSSYRAGADILKSSVTASSKNGKVDEEDPSFAPDFRYPTYVQEIMGNIFSLGFGPFRWVCTSADAKDLAVTDQLAYDVMEGIRNTPGLDERVRNQLADNMLWIKNAQENKLVVGSQARILYADAAGRKAIAEAMNKAIKDGRVSSGIVLSRDHHDVSGTDSPYRETSNIDDGSMFCADMSVQNAIGDSFRGATWVALHNGGGCGWGEVSNGGFGLYLDGSDDASRRASGMLDWDVNNGVARRAWARNDNAVYAVQQAMKANPLLKVTLPVIADTSAIDAACKKYNM
jgi:urocanate hydratase